jgi:hypothetical protein
VTDDRFSPEELEIAEAAKAAPPPPRRTEPCRRYVDVPPVSADEIEEFMKELEK